MLALEKEKREIYFQWDSIVEELAGIFHLTGEEKAKVYKSPAARLTAEIAYLSGCNDPERAALAHVGTIIIGMKSPHALHKPGESLYNRIALLNHYPGGDPEIVKGGMILLELISLYDHMRDKDDDRQAEKFNPLLDGMDFDTERERLLKVLHALNSNVQELYRMHIGFLPFCWWGG